MSAYVPPRSVRHPDRLLARSVFFLCLALYTATMVGLPDNADAEVEYQTTSALARTQRLALGGTPEADAIISLPRGDKQGFNVREGGAGREGRFYSWFGVGQALVPVPLWFVGAGLERVFPEVEQRHRATTHYGVPRSEYFQHLVVGWRNPLLGALTAWLLVLSARRMGASRRSAWIAALAYGLGTFAWPQARSTLSDVQATFTLFLSFHCLLGAREAYGHPEGRPRLWLAGSGAALALAFLTRVATAPAIAVLVVATAVAARRGRRDRRSTMGELAADLGVFALTAAAGVLVFCVTNSLRFGDPFETGYSSDVFSGNFFSYPPQWGLLGLLLAPGKGLLFMAPALVLAPLGLARAWRKGRRLLPWTCLAITVAVIAPVAPTQTWHGAWTYGPRYVLPLLPFAWLGVALAFDELAPHLGGRIVARALLVLGVLVALPGVLVDHMTHQDLALQAARVEWADAPGADERERDEDRFLRIQWDPRFAAPWAHWRILRHRVAVGDERYPIRTLFGVDDDALASPTHERDRGFAHFAWVDLRRRLGGESWIAALFCVALLWIGLVLSFRGFEAAQASGRGIR